MSAQIPAIAAGPSCVQTQDARITVPASGLPSFAGGDVSIDVFLVNRSPRNAGLSVRLAEPGPAAQPLHAPF